MENDFFQRSVILICEYNTEGCFGLVLNNYLDINFTNLQEDILNINAKIAIGGPVDAKNLFYLHTFGAKIPNSEKVTEQIYLGGDYTVLMETLRSVSNPESHVRFFLGYSGWSQGQLDDEINEKSWIVVQSDMPELIMDTRKSDLWQEGLQRLGRKYTLFSQIPLNPNNN